MSTYNGFELLRLKKPLPRNIATQLYGQDEACIKINGTGNVISVNMSTGLCPVGYMSVYKYLGMDGHNGTDFGCATGTPIFAVHDGTVTELETVVSKGLGITTITDNQVWFNNSKPDGLAYAKIVYWHLKTILVKVGDKIKAGQIIAEADNTGYSTGSHLHLGLYPVIKNGDKFVNQKINKFGGAVNPMAFMEDFAGMDLSDYQARLRGYLYYWIKALANKI
jgi:murein DD-endopeptidase MepM/ murein hydrolase activator NlpD